MFVGRAKELASLEKLYHKDSFQFAVVYGRRRVGKTIGRWWGPNKAERREEEIDFIAYSDESAI